MGSLLSGVLGIIPSIIGYFFDSPEIKAQKEQNKIELLKVEAEIKREVLATEAQATADYDTQAMRNMQSTWKDEYLIILHTLPIWGYVVPSETLHQGLDKVWDQLSLAPEWWWIVYVGMVASTFGLRWLFNKQRVDAVINGKK